jgi:hypothetical protein
MISNDFIKLYEELSELNEAKEDIQRLVDFAGQDLADRFLAVKPKLKAPENDLYYWIKKHSVDELESAVTTAETSVSKTQTKKNIADAGAKLVCDTEHWKVYEITTFEASQKYGRDTQWCITGVNDLGDEYWYRYTDQGIEFYFLITKGKYDPRGYDSKIAIAVYPNKLDVEVFNQQDESIDITDIPYCEELDIPGLDIKTILNTVHCYACNKAMQSEDSITGPRDNPYCHDCFNKYYFKCTTCGKTEYLDISFFEDTECNKHCSECGDKIESKFFDMIIDKLNDCYSKGIKDIEIPFKYLIHSSDPFIYFEGIQLTKEQLIDRIKAATELIPEGDRKAVGLDIFNAATSEVVFYKTGLTPSNIAAAKTAMDNHTLY